MVEACSAVLVPDGCGYPVADLLGIRRQHFLFVEEFATKGMVSTGEVECLIRQEKTQGTNGG